MRSCSTAIMVVALMAAIVLRRIPALRPPKSWRARAKTLVEKPRGPGGHGLHYSESSSSPDHTSRKSLSEASSSRLLSVLDPLIVCGPSGAGKGTIIARFMETAGGRQHFGFGVSHTTRASREGEVNGVHYHFVTVPVMQALIDQHAFVEYAHVHGHLYGTSWQAVRAVQQQQQHNNLPPRHCLLDIDVQGVRSVKQLAQQRRSGNILLQPRYIFIAPPSLAVLQARLQGRGSESEGSLETRLSKAAEEMEYGFMPANFDAVVTNDNLEQAVHDFRAAVHQLYDLPLD